MCSSLLLSGGTIDSCTLPVKYHFAGSPSVDGRVKAVRLRTRFILDIVVTNTQAALDGEAINCIEGACSSCFAVEVRR